MITTTQAIEAIKTIKEYCREQDMCNDCEISKFCVHEFRNHPRKDWKIPQERTEEHGGNI